MQRVDVVRALETVSRAQARQDMVPVLTCFWFTGKHLMCYDDEIALRVNFVTDFSGAVPKQLLPLLASSKAKTVEFAKQDSTLHVKAGRSSFRLPTLPANAFEEVFIMPRDKLRAVSDGETAKDKKRRDALVSALECCRLSVGSDTSRPEYIGVTVKSADDGSGLLYATTGKTLSHARVPKDVFPKVAKSTILSASFVEQAVRVAKTAKRVELGVFSDHAIVRADDVLLFGRVIDNSRGLDFAGVFERHCPDSALRRAVPLPQSLWGALERASIVVESKIAAGRVSLQARDDELRISAKSDLGEVRERIRRFGHADVEATFDVKALLAAGGCGFDSVVIGETCLVAVRNGVEFFVAASMTESTRDGG